MPVIVIVSDEQLRSAGVRWAVARLGYLLTEASTSARACKCQQCNFFFEFQHLYCPNCGARESLRPVEDGL